MYHVNQMRLKSIDNNSSFSFYQVRLEYLVNCMEKQIYQSYSNPSQEKIMKSMRNHWDGLTLFVKDPKISMDNNLSEREEAVQEFKLLNKYGGL